MVLPGQPAYPQAETCSAPNRQRHRESGNAGVQNGLGVAAPWRSRSASIPLIEPSCVCILNSAPGGRDRKRLGLPACHVKWSQRPAKMSGDRRREDTDAPGGEDAIGPVHRTRRGPFISPVRSGCDPMAWSMYAGTELFRSGWIGVHGIAVEPHRRRPGASSDRVLWRGAGEGRLCYPVVMACLGARGVSTARLSGGTFSRNISWDILRDVEYCAIDVSFVGRARCYSGSSTSPGEESDCPRSNET